MAMPSLVYLVLMILFGMMVDTTRAIYVFSPGYLSGQLPFSTANFGGFYLHNNCRDFKEVILAKPIDGCTLDASKNYTGKIVLTTRGKCTFIQKALAVEEMGGVGLVVVNQEKAEMHSMSDDGTNAGVPIRIRSVLIPYERGTKLIHYLQSQEDEADRLKVAADWKLPPLKAALGYCVPIDYTFF